MIWSVDLDETLTGELGPNMGRKKKYIPSQPRLWGPILPLGGKRRSYS